MRPILTTGFLLFASALGVYLLCLNGVWTVDHTTSFLELDYAMWTHHTFVLGTAPGFKPDSVDDFQYGGNYFSALAPGTSILALPLAGVGFMLDGHFTVFGYAMLFSEGFVALMNAVAVSLVYLVGRFFFSKRTSAFLALAYAFSTISWPFATYFFQSDVSATFCLLAVYFTLRATLKVDGRTLYSVAAGAAVAVGMLVDYVVGILLPIILVYLVLIMRRDGRALARPVLGFLATAVLGVAGIGAYDYINFGSPFRGTEQLYLHASSVFTEFSYPLDLGAYLNLFSPYRGLFIYSVFLVLGLFGFYEMVKSRPYRAEGLLLLACFLGIFIPYSMWYDPSGGEAFGPRFIVSAIPFLLLPAGMVLENEERGLQVAAYALYAFGVVVDGVAGLTSAVTPMYNPATWSFMKWTLPLFLSGGMDTWWLRYVGRLWPVPSVMIIGTALAAPLVARRLLETRERSAVQPADAPAPSRQ